jgi:hypothetical protein
MPLSDIAGIVAVMPSVQARMPDTRGTLIVYGA